MNMLVPVEHERRQIRNVSQDGNADRRSGSNNNTGLRLCKFGKSQVKRVQVPVKRRNLLNALIE